jgi:hypothetical protein
MARDFVVTDSDPAIYRGGSENLDPKRAPASALRVGLKRFVANAKSRTINPVRRVREQLHSLSPVTQTCAR